MFIPDQAQVAAAASALREALERVIAEHLSVDAAEPAPGLKVVAATIVMMSASLYAKKLGLPRQMALGVAATAYDVEAPASPASAPKIEDS